MKSTILDRIRTAISPTKGAMRAAITVFVAGAAIAACDVHGVSAPGTLATIEVTPNMTLSATSTQQMTAVGRDADGRVLLITPAWSIAANGGTINQAGVFTAGVVTGVFSNTVMATVGTISGTASITVTPGVIATIAIVPSPVTLAAASKQQFVAVGKDANGNVVQFTPTWTILAGGGTIDLLGNFTAGNTPGTFSNTVQVSNNGIKALATVIVTIGPLAVINVTPTPATLTPNATQQFTATGTDVAGNAVVITPVWAVVANGGAISATGLFTAGAVSGTFANTVRASFGGITGVATVIVTSGPLATITVTPNPVTMPANSTQAFIAVGKDASGNVFVITPVWSVVTGGGLIDNTGLFTAGAVAGAFANTIKATSGAVSGTATVNVTAVVPVVSALNSAAAFGVLAGTGITCAISGSITGATGASNIGSSPTLTITGFPPCTFSGSIPAPAVIATAKGDLTAAYLAAQGQVCNTVLTGSDLGFYDGSTPAKTLAPGTYCFATSAALTGTMKLTGSAAAKWTFQIGSTLTANVGSSVILAGGAIPDNITWAVGSSATLNTNAAFQGNILAFTSITMQNGTSLLGRALAQNGAVDMTAGAATITKP